MNILDFSTEQKEWIDRNPQLAQTILASAVNSALLHERARDKRKKELLEPMWRERLPGRSSFSFRRDFESLGESKGGSLIKANVGSRAGFFDEWFLDKVETDIPEVELVVSSIYPGSREVPYPTEPEIRERLGEDNAEIFLSHACSFLERARLGHSPWYCFYVRDLKGVLRVIHAEWRWFAESSWYGWSLSANQIGYHDELRNGGRTVSRPYV